MILIIVESLGAPVAPDVADLQLQSLLQLDALSGVSVTRGSIPFHGSTVPAELRELCSVRSGTLHPDVTAIAAACLPLQLRQHGYHGTAIHGFSGSMFSRNLWYRQLGFDDIRFAPDVLRLKPDASRCGIAFNGICDQDAWDFLLDQVLDDERERQFIYWLTLSAHLPLVADEQRGEQAHRDCAVLSDLQTQFPVCLLIHQHRSLFTRIAGTVASGRFRDTLLIVVGDHAPPFIRPPYRQVFSDTHVPYLIIDIAP